MAHMARWTSINPSSYGHGRSTDVLPLTALIFLGKLWSFTHLTCNGPFEDDKNQCNGPEDKHDGFPGFVSSYPSFRSASGEQPWPENLNNHWAQTKPPWPSWIPWICPMDFPLAGHQSGYIIIPTWGRDLSCHRKTINYPWKSSNNII